MKHRSSEAEADQSNEFCRIQCQMLSHPVVVVVEADAADTHQLVHTKTTRMTESKTRVGVLRRIQQQHLPARGSSVTAGNEVTNAITVDRSASKEGEKVKAGSPWSSMSVPRNSTVEEPPRSCRRLDSGGVSALVATEDELERALHPPEPSGDLYSAGASLAWLLLWSLSEGCLSSSFRDSASRDSLDALWTVAGVIQSVGCPAGTGLVLLLPGNSAHSTLTELCSRRRSLAVLARDEMVLEGRTPFFSLLWHTRKSRVNMGGWKTEFIEMNTPVFKTDCGTTVVNVMKSMMIKVDSAWKYNEKNLHVFMSSCLRVMNGVGTNHSRARGCEGDYPGDSSREHERRTIRDCW